MQFWICMILTFLIKTIKLMKTTKYTKFGWKWLWNKLFYYKFFISKLFSSKFCVMLHRLDLCFQVITSRTCWVRWLPVGVAKKLNWFVTERRKLAPWFKPITNVWLMVQKLFQLFFKKMFVWFVNERMNAWVYLVWMILNHTNRHKLPSIN